MTNNLHTPEPWYASKTEILAAALNDALAPFTKEGSDINDLIPEGPDAWDDGSGPQ